MASSSLAKSVLELSLIVFQLKILKRCHILQREGLNLACASPWPLLMSITRAWVISIGRLTSSLNSLFLYLFLFSDLLNVVDWNILSKQFCLIKTFSSLYFSKPGDERKLSLDWRGDGDGKERSVLILCVCVFCHQCVYWIDNLPTGWIHLCTYN